MEPRTNNESRLESRSTQLIFDCCQESHDAVRIPRRDFLTTAGGAVLAASAIGGVLPAGRVWAKPNAAGAAAVTGTYSAKSSPESMVKVLYDTLSPKQREDICFAWD